VRLPSFEDGVLIAGRLLRRDPDDVRRLIKSERLYRALLAPNGRVAGHAIYPTPAAAGKCLLVHCALDDIVPSSAPEFGWLMFMRFLELNGYRWKSPANEVRTLRRLASLLREGIDPGHGLRSWLEACIEENGVVEARRRKDRRVHIGSPVTGRGDAERKQLETWEDAVDRAITEFELERTTEHEYVLDGPQLSSDRTTTFRPQFASVRVHAKDDQDAIDQIEERILRADAAIFLIDDFGSAGVGIELRQAYDAMLPMLVLRPSGDDLSPKVERLLELHGSRNSFEFPTGDRAPKAIRELVLSWLHRNYRTIVTTAERRRLAIARLAPFYDSLRAAETRLSRRELDLALAEVGLSPRRARLLSRDKRALAFATQMELLALSAAYNVPLNVDGFVPEPTPARPQYLLDRELDALGVFLSDRPVSAEVVTRLIAQAQRRIAYGQSRVSFAYPVQWARLMKGQ